MDEGLLRIISAGSYAHNCRIAWYIWIKFCIFISILTKKRKKWARLRLDPSHCAPGFLLQQSVLDHSATTNDKHFIHPLPVLVRLKLHDPWVCALYSTTLGFLVRLKLHDPWVYTTLHDHWVSTIITM